MSAEHGDNEHELGPDDILADGHIKKGIKEQNQLEVAIGDGMEFTIHGDLKNKTKKTKTLMNNVKVSCCQVLRGMWPNFCGKRIRFLKFIAVHFY